MKKFFNFPTIVMAVLILAAIVSALLAPAINWTAVIWMFIAAMWVYIARLTQVTVDDLRNLNTTSAKLIDQLKKKWVDVANEKDELEAKYQALDNEYVKLAKQHEATLRENAELYERVDDRKEQQLGAPVENQEPAVHGNIKIKKRGKRPEVKADVQDKTE